MDVGHRIRTLREAGGLTQTALAGRVGVSPRYISQIEAGDRQGRFDVLDRIATALGVSVAAFSEASIDALPAAAGSVPVSGTVADAGLVQSEIVAKIVGPGLHRMAGAYDLSRRIPVTGGAPEWFAIEATTDLERAGIRTGDLLVFDPTRVPQADDIVVASWNKGRKCRLRRYRELDGEIWLWPLDDHEDSSNRLTDLWRIVAVAVELRRPLSRG